MNPQSASYRYEPGPRLPQIDAMNPDRFSTETLRSLPRGDLVCSILAAALAAVEPAEALRRFVQRRGEQLTIGSRAYDLGRIRRVRVIGAGKAGAPMAAALASILGDRIDTGAVVVKEGHRGQEPTGPVEILEASHPLPDPRGVEAARRIGSLVSGLEPDDLVICLISGGGSALLVSPAEGIRLAELQELTAALLVCGAEIGEINTLRKHLERLKGGQLARLASPAQVATLVLSDVVGDPLESIASGPTAPDGGTFAQALAVVERYHLVERVPAGILEHLRRGERGEIPDTPKAEDPLFARVAHTIIGSNRLAAQAALHAAHAAGLNGLLLTTYLQGEARSAGRMLAAIARQIHASGEPLPRPACLVLGGETTVTLQGQGLGGRNQELALAAVEELAGLPHILLAALATDGGDGPTDAAGAVAGGETLERARRLGLDPRAALERNDSYHFFAPLGDLLKTGPTLTNVNDLAFLFSF